MLKEIKPVGMVHIPGLNDEQWKKFLEDKEKQQATNNLWYQLP